MHNAELTIEQFNDEFFAMYEAEFETVDFHEQATVALSDILQVKTADGIDRTYDQIQAEAELFFSNPDIMQDMNRFDTLARQYAAFCQSHGEGMGGGLESVLSGSDSHSHKRANTDASHDHADDEDDDDEKDKKYQKNEKKCNKKKHIRRGWFACCNIVKS